MPALKAEKPWQHLRAMYDFGSPDAKRGPSWQDLYAMYPKPPNCTCKWTHKARILPFRSRKACISGKHCQEEGLLRAFVEKRTHTARFLPGGAVKQPQREGWMRALWSAAAGMAGAAGVAGEADGSARVTAHARAANIRRHSSSVTHLWPRWGSRRCGAVIVGNDRCGGLLQGVVAVETAAAGNGRCGDGRCGKDEKRGRMCDLFSLKR